jgi:hypothetical protein
MPRTTSQQRNQIWRDRLQRFGRSQQSVQDFCNSEGCTPRTFYYWRQKIDGAAQPNASAKQSRKTPTSQAASSAFVPVVLRDIAPRRITIRIQDGTRVSVPSDALAALEIILGHSHQVAQ